MVSFPDEAEDHATHQILDDFIDTLVMESKTGSGISIGTLKSTVYE